MIIYNIKIICLNHFKTHPLKILIKMLFLNKNHIKDQNLKFSIFINIQIDFFIINNLSNIYEGLLSKFDFCFQ